MERAEFERLALDELDLMHRAAFQLCRDHATAADLVQDTYYRALRSAHRFEDRGDGVRPWLFAILHNVFYSHLDKQTRRPTPVDSIHGEDHRERPPDEPPPAWNLASLDWEHVDSRITKAIESLDPDSRTALLLWGVEGMKYREIADMLNIPVGTVMSRLHRARKKIADQLKDTEFASPASPGTDKTE